MTGDGDQRTLEPPGHVLDAARFATAGWSFENHRQASGMCRRKQVNFAVYRQVIRLFGNLEFFDSSFGHKRVNRKSLIVNSAFARLCKRMLTCLAAQLVTRSEKTYTL